MSWTYDNVKLIRVVDGDTVDLEVDLGFRLKTIHRFRLRGYNAPEARGPEFHLGQAAKLRLDEVLEMAMGIRITTHKADSFGRWLCDVEIGLVKQYDGTPIEYVDLVGNLILEGWGVPWDGKGKRPSFDPDPAVAYPLVAVVTS